MEGSAISRSVSGPKRINQSRDPDMDGTWTSHPAVSNVVSNASKATPSQSVGRDGFTDSDPRGGGPKIKGGQNG